MYGLLSAYVYVCLSVCIFVLIYIHMLYILQMYYWKEYKVVCGVGGKFGADFSFWLKVLLGFGILRRFAVRFMTVLVRDFRFLTVVKDSFQLLYIS